MKIETLFTSFIASTTLPDVDNDELIKYAYQCKDTSQGVIKSNAFGWQSDPLTVPNKEVGKLANLIHNNISSVADCWKLRNDKTLISLENIWININSKAAFNRPHVHPESLFSGSYYVKTPSQEGGAIVFVHPAVNFQYHLNADIVEDWNDFTSASYRIFPKAGDLLIFPSFLVHYVEPNTTDEDRISIAFNAGLVKL